MVLKFAKTRWTYDSYTDFWKLVELSGFPTCYVDEMDIHNPEHTYIVAPMNGEWKQYLDGQNYKQRTSTLWLWNLERPGGSGSLQQYMRDNQSLIDEGYLNMVIVSDKELAKLTNFHFVPVGSHPGLNPTPTKSTDKPYDLIHLSCYSNNRSLLFTHPGVPKTTLLGMSVAPNSWGILRDLNLKSSKFMLNVHQDSNPFCEPLRFALSYAYRLPIYSQYCTDPWPYSFCGGQDTVTDLLHHVKLHVQQYGSQIHTWKYATDYNHSVYCTGEFSFRRCIERFL